MGLRPLEGQQRPPLLFGEGPAGVLRQTKGTPPASLDEAWQRGWARGMKGAPEHGCRGVSSRHSLCHLPAATAGPARLVASARGQGAGQARGGRSQACGDRCVGGGLSGQVALSEPSECLEQIRQTDGVTPKSPRAWLGATGSWDNPQRLSPATIAPIKFLPIKWPVFLLSKPCQQWSLGKRLGGWHPGGGALRKRANRMCALSTV